MSVVFPEPAMPVHSVQAHSRKGLARMQHGVVCAAHGVSSDYKKSAHMLHKAAQWHAPSCAPSCRASCCRQGFDGSRSSTAYR